ncbi:MAG: sigma-70 family RNA polymerase sigma factor [Candidatus Aminicenantes bacterium]|nr:sigma-70 family RNA polymerase sigma factor [Candidatus Aminicenantes bacterium]
MDEQTLVELSRNGRRDAFEQLVVMYNQKVFALAYGFVRDRATADDLTQEILLKVYQALPSFRVESEFGTWLYRIAVNHVKDHLRKASRRRTVSLDQVGEGPMAVDGGAESRVQASEEEKRRREVFRMLETLPDKYRIILTLRDVEGLPYEEVARTLGIAPGTVDSRLHRARKMLRKKMSPYLRVEGGRP